MIGLSRSHCGYPLEAPSREGQIIISFIKMHKGQLTTYNATTANKINVM